MSNFNPFAPPAAAVAPAAANPRWYHNFNRREAAAAIRQSGAALTGAHDVINGLGEGVSASADQIAAFEDAARNFNNSASRLGFANGKLGASVKGLVRSMADYVGINTERWGSTTIRGEVGTALDRTLISQRGNLAERIISKPIRFLAERPMAAVIGLGAAAIATVGGVIHNRAAHRTQANAMAYANGLDSPQVVNNYMNSVPPEQMALLNSRLQGNGGPQVAFADKARAPQAAASTTANLAAL